MRTRKHPCPVETVWVDKHKYDEAERLHYEREAVVTAIASEELKVETLNGTSQDESSETGPDGEHRKPRNGKKQRKRRSPKHKNLVPRLNFVLAGLLADRVWFDRHLYEKAECEYQTKLATDLAKVLLNNKPTVKPSTLVSNPEEEPTQSLNTRMASHTIMNCNHGDLVACHHIIHGVWVNKVHFGNAEMSFIERYQSPFSLQPLLDLPLILHDDYVSSMRRTPDEGYMSAMPTPATPVASNLPDHEIASGAARTSRFPVATNSTVNGKPQWARWQELIAEVWLDKPVYDDAERYFYENMFGSHSVTNAESNECQKLQQEVMKKNKKYQHGAVKQLGVKSEGPSGSLEESVNSFLHKDSDHMWLSKPVCDEAESQYYASTAQLMSTPGQAKMDRTMQLEEPSHLAVRDHQLKKMATEYLVHEKIWFDKFKYDDAERQYYEQLNGPVTTTKCQQQSPAPPTGADHCDFIARVANLELENQNLHKVVEDLQLAISKLETRVKVLETSSTSHAPAVAATLQPLVVAAASIKKIEVVGATAAVEDEDEDDDDIDLFGSDEEEDEEAARIREERLRQYSEKKSKKPGLIAKSSILLDVKPWDDETDMAKVEECVRTVQMDGLVWGSSKLVPVGYGIRKLQIQCVVEDDKVGTDMLEDEITKFDDYVQSVDIAAFNKI
uniref:Elongation factor 1-delta n=1 Tax=Geotrypetes seraphini TaxID=260995 RepID=A0A6P8PYF4_GEOSA|nr:elongation factor 1-delta isoform X2 [Geotrypetes seraphini]